MAKRHILLLLLIVFVVALCVVFISIKNKNNQKSQKTPIELNYTCSEFVLNDKPVECNTTEALSFNRTDEYVHIIDKIEKDNDSYYLVTQAKNETGQWITQKFYIGEKESILVIKTQQDNFLRLAQVKTLNRETVNVKDLPDYIDNQKLKGKEVAILVSKKPLYNQEYKKVSLIRYITNQ